MEKNKAIFVDRDGVIAELSLKSGRNRLYKIEDFAEIPGSFAALAKLQQSGYKIIMVTNQAGIAKGIFTEKDYRDLTRYIEIQAQKLALSFEAIYFCPFHKDAICRQYQHPNHPDRKPNPGMLEKAINQFKLEPKLSYMLGDNISDMQAGAKVGLKNILVLTGHGKRFQNQLLKFKIQPVYVAANLPAAAEWILNNA